MSDVPGGEPDFGKATPSAIEQIGGRRRRSRRGKSRVRKTRKGPKRSRKSKMSMRRSRKSRR